MKIISFIILFVISISSVEAVATSGLPQKAVIVPLYTYHTHPPFIVKSGSGLSYDFANYLTKKSGGLYEFVVKSMSRPRVEKMIKEQKKGIVPWVNPVWFKDKTETRYMWSKGVLMTDSNALISHKKLKLVYDGPASLKGLIFGGVRSHVYAGVDDYIEKTGQVKRVNADNHVDNFRKLSKHRIDVTITPKSAADYIIKTEGLSELFISPKPHSRYERRMIIINDRQKLLSFVEKVIATMKSDPEWKNIMDMYR